MKRTIYAHHFGKRGPLGYRYGSNAAALLMMRGWTVTKWTRSYVYLLPPPGVRVLHDTPVEIDAPSNAQILEQATAAHEKGGDQFGEMMTDVGVWPWRYRAYRSEVITQKTTLLDAQGAHHGTEQTRLESPASFSARAPFELAYMNGIAHVRFEASGPVLSWHDEL